MTLTLAYRRVEINRRSAIHPSGRVVFRPILKVKIQHQSATFTMLAIVDTGADFTIFPSAVARALGIQAGVGEQLGRVNVLGRSADCALVPVTLSINDQIRVRSDVGFTDALSGSNIGLLGRGGFIDRLDRLTFLPQEQIFEIQCSDGYRI